MNIRSTKAAVVILVFFLSALLVLPASGEETSKPRILVLHAYNYGFSWTDNISHGIQTALDKNAAEIELIFEFLDTRRVFSESYFKKLQGLFALKYADKAIDVIICSDDHALNFVIDYDLFKDVPLVFCSVSGFDPEKASHREFTGLKEAIDIEESLKVALQQNPGTKNVAVITDLTKTGKALKKKAFQVFQRYGDRLSFQYLEDLTVEDLMERVAQLPDDTIIFLFIFSRDKAGRVFSHERNLSLLRKHASVPIYAVWEFYLGYGIIGGKLTSGKAEGKMAAELALRIINGEKASTMPLQTSPTQYMFDYGQLEKFDIDVNTLPPGSIVINRPFSLYETYKTLIWSTIAILATLMVIITMLAYNIVLRKKAEGESRARAAELTLNVAELKESQVSLRESEHKFRSFFDSNPDSIIMMDLDGIIRSVNKSFIKAADYMYNEIIGKHYSKFLLEKYHGETLKRFANLKAGIVQDSDLDVEYIRKDGGLIPVRIKGWQIVDEESNVILLGIFIKDISAERMLAQEKATLERQLQHTQKMESIGTLAGGIAHDFNNILGAIIGYTELSLMEIKPEMHTLRENLKRILEAGNRSKELIQQILKFSRMEKGSFQQMSLTLIAKEAVKLLESTIPKSIKIERHFKADQDTIMADHSQIHQIIMNLCTNAYHAMRDKGGELTVALENVQLDTPKQFLNMKIAPGSYARLDIQDTGKGIAANTINQIFEPYFTTKTRGEGTGLGLSVTYGIVQNHHGLIEVASRQGKGSLFSVYLPIAAGGRSLPVSEGEAIPMGRGQHILAVDDEEFFLDIIRQYLEGLDYKVDAFQSGKQALDAFNKNPRGYHLIVSDQTMPGMTGVELITEIRRKNKEIPVILCTGYSDLVTEQTAQHYGISRFLQKPVNRRELGTAVNRLMPTSEIE